MKKKPTIAELEAILEEKDVKVELLPNGEACVLPDPLRPPLSLLVKLGSIAVHAEEMLSPNGHDYDRQAILVALEDSELREWIEEMSKRAFLPVKR